MSEAVPVGEGNEVALEREGRAADAAVPAAALSPLPSSGHGEGIK